MSRDTSRFSSRFGGMIDVIAQIFCACKIEPYKTPPSTAVVPPDRLVEFPQGDYELIFLKPKKLLHKIIRTDMNTKAVIRIAKHYCWESLSNTKFFWTSLIDDGLELAPTKSDAVKPYMQIFMGLIELEDSVVDKRIGEGVEFFLQLLKDNLTPPHKDKETFEKLVIVLGKLFEIKGFKNCIMKRDNKSKLSSYLTQGGFTLTKPS